MPSHAVALPLLISVVGIATNLIFNFSRGVMVVVQEDEIYSSLTQMSEFYYVPKNPKNMLPSKAIACEEPGAAPCSVLGVLMHPVRGICCSWHGHRCLVLTAA